jgi:hypothetical protein
MKVQFRVMIVLANAYICKDAPRRLLSRPMAGGLCAKRQRPGLGGKKVALVIGDANYQHTPVLHNPCNDAESVARFFQKIGFESP